jgi:N-acetyl-anhydromuramoyl-L-alanine amidase
VLIQRDGLITQYVPFGERAWHAGQSSYQGREGCNDFSIGIELEGTADIPYTDAQYEQLAAVVEVLLRTYPSLSPERIAGHNDIAPGRKWDPGPSFDWARWRSLLTARLRTV